MCARAPHSAQQWLLSLASTYPVHIFCAIMSASCGSSANTRRSLPMDTSLFDEEDTAEEWAARSSRHVTCRKFVLVNDSSCVCKDASCVCNGASSEESATSEESASKKKKKKKRSIQDMIQEDDVIQEEESAWQRNLHGVWYPASDDLYLDSDSDSDSDTDSDWMF